MKDLRIISALVLGLTTSCLYAAATPHAGNRPGIVGLTLGDGRMYFSSRRHINNANLPFAALSYNFTAHWGIELMGGAFSSDSMHPVDSGRRVDGGVAAFDAVYHLTGKAVEPFVMAGVGLWSISPNGTDARQQGNINVAVGAQYFITKAIALRIQGSDFYTLVGGKNDAFVGAGVSLFRDWA